MEEGAIKITYLGGPPALLEIGGPPLLTDPACDSAGSEYDTGYYRLRIDAVLLSHDHHFDKLDHAERALLAREDQGFTTPAGAGRLVREARDGIPKGAAWLPCWSSDGLQKAGA